MASFASLPPEILREIVQLVYLDSIPLSIYRTIDPQLPSAYPDGRRISSTQNETRNNLYALCLVNRALYHHARPLLFRRVVITLPFSFLLLLRTLGAAHLATVYDKYAQTGALNVDPSDPMSFDNMVAAAGFAHATGNKLVVGLRGRGSNMTPPASRSGSPATRKGTISIDDEREMELVWTEELEPGRRSPRYHVTLKHFDSSISDVHRWVRVLDFSNFRTQGLRRTIGQGMDARFVTPAKLLALITSAEGLVAFGACETMDSALSVEVLEALLFRDGEWSKPSSVRGVSIERRGPRTHKMLESLDLCNCVSPRFAEALAKFVEQHLNKFSNRVTETVLEETESEDSEDDERGRSRRTARGSGSRAHTQQQRSVSIHRDDNLPSKHPALPTRFPSLRRLGLAGITFGTELLNPFVLAFPRLTHLDLSGTKASASLLNALGSSSTVQLESLSLARCRRLDSESITEFLVDSPVTANITELSLEGTLIFPTPLTPEDLKTIITSAPCFRAGQLRYLDLGGCLLTDEHLDALTPQPALLDLGLASCPRISLQAVSKTLRERAPNVQILELTDSCTATPANIPALTSNSSPHRAGAIGVMQLQSVLLGPCSSVPPPPLSQQLALLGLGSAGSSTSPTRQTDGNGFAISPPRPPTNLRVVGLSAPTLRSVRGGLGTWRSIWGAGQRGWIVDTAAGALPTMQSTSSSSSSDPDSTPSAQGQTSRFPSAPGSHSHSVSPHATISSPSVRRAASSASASSRSRSRAPPMPPAPSGPRDEVVRDLPPGHPRRQALEALARAEGHVPGNTGWHSKKMEVLFGFGLLGRESGSYALLSYQM